MSGALLVAFQNLPEVVRMRLQHLARDVGGVPTKRQAAEMDAGLPWAARNRFGSWNKAVKASGLTPRPWGRPRLEGNTREGVVRRIQQLTAELGRTPSRREAETMGRGLGSAAIHAHGSWGKALRAAWK